MKDFQIIEKIYESDDSLIYRAIRKSDNLPIILKILKENYPTPAEFTRYKQEYETTRALNVDSIIKAYDLQRYENSLVIVLEDFGGQSLKLLLSQMQSSLENFLTIAIKITEGLAAIHTANIIHKDINPSNIVYNPETEELKIIDFGISTRLPQEFPAVCPPNQLEGTLAYIAPEQTGRMNRGIDFRSDFYSLGVTFHELLTNRLPFISTDPMELVHYHIAQPPIPVYELIPDIPLAISNIIVKLLAKTPEERYQSSFGIKADLEECLNQLRVFGQIHQFPLGSQDIVETFHIPQKLYGRKQEVNQLITTFEEVSQGTTRMILISGYSGIGKSALVSEIHKPITGKRGQFINGKFDQLKRDIPYFAISQAFQDLVHQLLSQPEINLQTWKKRILEALGNNGQIIIDVIPEVEKIIGKQPLVEDVDVTENQNRFNLFFKRFLSIFCQKEHPLVLFLDDLQWADLPSLNLIEQLISDLDNQYFLMIGAYRDNEVDSTHPLVHTLEIISQAQISLKEITLSSLKINHINQLIADALGCSTEFSKSLAELVAKKTNGNPFFLTQLLHSFYHENLLVFNRPQSFENTEDDQIGYWQWDIEQIKKVSITDNVIELMVSKIEKLDQKTQHIIKLAACIGNYFNLEILSSVNNKPQTVTAKELQSALDEGMIIPLDNNYKIPLLWDLEDLSNEIETICADIPYKLLHDRVQQAAYSLIPEEEKKQIHLQIGYMLLQNIKEDGLQHHIFDIVNHLNEGSALIIEQQKKNELAQLNLQAGKKAKASTAYASALSYFEAGINLLTLDSWGNQYGLTMELHLETLESLYLNTKFEQVETFAETTLKFSKNIADTLKIYQIKSLLYYVKLKSHKAIEDTRKALAELDVNLPIHPNEIEENIHQKKKRINFLLTENNIRDLATLPAMYDNHKLLVISILQSMISPTLTTNFLLFLWVILTQLDFCLRYGNPPQAASIYSYYGMILCSESENIDLGYELGNLSIEIKDHDRKSRFDALVTHLYYGFIWHWKEPLRNRVAEKKILHGIQKGIDIGDNEFASYTAITFCFIKFFGGYNLEDVVQVYAKYLKWIKTTRQEYSLVYIKICNNLANNLINPNQTELVIGDCQEEEDSFLEDLTNNNEWLLFIFYLAKTIICYFSKDYVQSYDYGLKAKQYIRSTGAYLPAPQYNFYSSLSFAAYYQDANVEKKEELIKQIESNQEILKNWTTHCAENFQHKYDLVEAERARLLAENWQAEELYERAIQGAKRHGFIHEEAIAYERAAEFYLAQGREEIGQFYLRNAYHCYSHWRAKTKVKQLEDEYPQCLLGITNKSKFQTLSTTISTADSNGEILDLATVIKASQAISGEMKLEKILQNLMKILIENAGAQKGFLLLNQGGDWVVEAQGTVNHSKITLLQSIPIDSIDPETSIPILPTTIINYVSRTKEYIVLNQAVYEGQFINDPYIIATQSKSILCTPLLNQGQLKGIVYLENNLVTGAFTSERVELLKILSAQAAISIDNSRLYQTLEQRVEERTKELSQTLEVLKATQAELIFENDLLRSSEQPSTFDYQVGGSLPMDAPTYVVRSADRNLYNGLKQGEFCYILHPRQMGKSSLMVRMMRHLQREGFSCAAIDMTRIGSENITPEQWYKGFVVELCRSFGLPKNNNLKTWWNQRKDIPPVQRLSQFIEEFLLIDLDKEVNASPQKRVILIDEIDHVLGLDFSVNDFFALIRACYNQRSLNPDYQRLTFVLLGVATPSDLIGDRLKTPFNIGKAIQLEGFKEHEAQPLLSGLAEKVSNPQVLLKEILAWTGGQPFLTQKICKLVHSSSDPIPTNKEAEWTENLVRRQVIENWESQDEPEHLRTIRDRILKSDQQPEQLLKLYKQILDRGEIAVVSIDSPEEKELLLSGLVIKHQGTLRVCNRIYQLIFDHSWIKANVQKKHIV